MCWLLGKFQSADGVYLVSGGSKETCSIYHMITGCPSPNVSCEEVGER